MRKKGRGPSICHVMDEEKGKGSEYLSGDGCGVTEWSQGFIA